MACIVAAATRAPERGVQGDPLAADVRGGPGVAAKAILDPCKLLHVGQARDDLGGDARRTAQGSGQDRMLGAIALLVLATSAAEA